jgi:hypothetical protein
LHYIGEEWDELIPGKYFFTSETMTSSCPKGTFDGSIFYQNRTKTPNASAEEKEDDEEKRRHT